MSEPRRRVLRIVAGLAGIVGLLVALLLVRTATISTLQVNVPATTFKALPGAAERLSRAVRFETISNADASKMDMAVFAQFNESLVAEFPRAHAVLQRELVGPCSVVYTWPGSDPKRRPVLLASHTDVVPVEVEQLAGWTHPPFSGDIADGYIWGRGTLDDKVGVLGLLEGVEVLATAGHQPQATLVLAFGCDEEVGGEVGAKQIATLFAQRKQSFEFALDEGLVIVQGYMPGTAYPVALVGIVEKGFGTFTLTVDAEGGHSSMPPTNSAIGILAQAITRLEARQMPAGLNEASRQMFETIAPEVGFGLRIVFANLWLLEPVLIKILAGKPATNATIRTTTAVTIMRAGVQDNVLPKQAVAKVNFRLAPGDSLEDVRDHIIAAVDDDRVQVVMPPAKGFANPASNISSADTDGFRAIRDAVRATFGNEVIVTPGSTTGGTDVRLYAGVSDNQYRFAPLLLKKELEDTARIHGTDERISLDGYELAIVFYADFLSRL